MNNTKFYICEKCGNIVHKVKDSGVPVVCCGQKMTYLEPGIVEASHEKHVPVIAVNGQEVTVTVGEVAHPMLDAHYITFVALETDKGAIVRQLKPGEEPVAKFTIASDEKVIAAYEYCNLHGLWMAKA